MLKMRELGVNLVPVAGKGGGNNHKLYMSWSNCNGCDTNGSSKENCPDKPDKPDKPNKPPKNTAALNAAAAARLKRQLDSYLAR